jgi:hypothetical protein
VDSAAPVQSELGTIESDTGGAVPAFWGQYIYTYSFSALTKADADQDLSEGIHLLLLEQDDTNSPTNTEGASNGTSEGDEAVDAAKALGVPAGVAIFKDIEQGSAVNGAFIEAWYNAVSAGGYRPGLYGNPVNGEFSGAYCSAVASDSAVGSTDIYTSEYEPLYETKPSGPASAPAWSDAAWPSCASQHAAWQYNEPNMSGQPDEDEATPGAPLWGASATTSTTSNLLSNASFGAGTFAPWSTIAVKGGKVNYAAYDTPAGTAEQGSWYGASNTSTAGGSIYQDAGVTTSPGQSYTFSIWIRSSTTATVTGTVALYGLGGTLEVGATNFSAGDGWKLVSVPLDVTKTGHTSLRAQVYENTTGVTYFYDGAQLINDDLDNASFDSGTFAPWSTIAVKGGKVNYTAYDTPAGTAEQGSWYGASNTSTGGGSIYQDASTSTSPGQSYTFSIWIRSATTATVTGTAALYGLGGTLEVGATNFSVGDGWKLVSVPLDITKTGHTSLRAQVYENTTGVTYFYDGAQLINDDLDNASFGAGTFSPWSTIAVKGGKVNYAAYDTPAGTAEQGSWYGASNTSTGGGSIYQDAAVTTSPGQSYTFSIWIRSSTSTTVTGTIAIYGLGGTLEDAGTNFSVGAGWALVSVPLDVTKAGHSTIRAQVYENTTGVTYFFDGAALAAQQ